MVPSGCSAASCTAESDLAECRRSLARMRRRTSTDTGQANFVRPASPGTPDAHGVEPRERLLPAVVVNLAEQADLTAAALRLAERLAVEFLAQVGIAFQSQHQVLVVQPVNDEGHGGLARRQG